LNGIGATLKPPGGTATTASRRKWSATAGLLQQTQALSATPFSFRVQLQMGPPDYVRTSKE